MTACFAVAGPVTNNCVSFTNRDSWSIEGDDIARTFGIQVVKLVNDFVAVGYGLLTLKDETECQVLQAAPKVHGAPIACIGAGTGLGECFLTVGPRGHYVCYPTEGGHTEFAPRSPLEIRLLAALLKKFKSHHRVSVERVVSGIGLWNVTTMSLFSPHPLFVRSMSSSHRTCRRKLMQLFTSRSLKLETREEESLPPTHATTSCVR
jgi:glucokinase